MALRDLRWAVFLVAALLPAYLIRFKIGQFPFTLLEIFLLVTVAVWFFKDRRRHPIAPERLRPWRWPLLLFLCAGIVSVLIAPDQLAALGLFRAYLLEPILFFLVCLSTLRDRQDGERMMVALAISAVGMAGYAVWQRFTGIGIPSPWDAEQRVTSFYPFPNAVGLFLGPLIPLFVAKIFYPSLNGRGWGGWPTLFWILTASLSLLGIIFSKTEGAWIGVFLGLVILGFLYRPRRFARWFFLAVAIGLLLAPPQWLLSAKQKILLQDWSGQVRRTQWSETIAMLADRPVLGAGLSGYPATFAPYHRAIYIEIFQYPHNIVLNFWSELGLLGLVSFAWIMVTFFRLMTKTLSLGRSIARSFLSLGLLASLAAILIHGLVDVPYFKNDLAIQFWIFMAMVTVMALPKDKIMVE